MPALQSLYEVQEDGIPQIREAACWAHLRRAFHDVWTATGSPIAKEALERIGELYDIERAIAGQSAEHRREVRQQRSRPRAEAFRAWCEDQLGRLPAKGDLAKGDALRAAAMGRLHPVPPGRPYRHRQQSGRAGHPPHRDEAFIVPPFFKCLETLKVGSVFRRDTGDLFARWRR